jgi:voltage-gated potassium channel
MVLGYSIIAVPTGIVTSEITFAAKSAKEQRCVVCGEEGLNEYAKFCRNCASKLTG